MMTFAQLRLFFSPSLTARYEGFNLRRLRGLELGQTPSAAFALTSGESPVSACEPQTGVGTERGHVETARRRHARWRD